MVSAIHKFINPLTLYAVHAPTWDLPATLRYCCPVTVLEWKSGHDFVLPPVTKLESLLSHRPHPPQDIERYLGHYPFSSDVDIGPPSDDR